MADHGHHDPGGHELEAINTKLLFRLLISLTAVTLLASLAVVQWFYSQRRELEAKYAAEGSFQLIEYKTRMSADLEGIDRVAQNLAADPKLLQAPPPPSGWIHPDDLVGGGTAPAAPAEAPKQPEPTPAAPPADDHGHEGHDHGHEGHDHGAPADDADKPADDADKPDDDADKPINVPAEKPAEPADAD